VLEGGERGVREAADPVPTGAGVGLGAPRLRPETSKPVVCLDGLPGAAPRRTLPHIRVLLRATLPLPMLDAPLALAVVDYAQRHNLAAYQ